MKSPLQHIFVLFLLIIMFSPAQSNAQTGNTPFSMGMNLSWPSYYDNVIYFTDVTRHAGQWISFNPDADAWNDEHEIPLTENGYPAQLAPDQAVRLLIFIDSLVAPSGEYTMEWEGSGTFQVYLNGETFTPDIQDNTAVIPVSEQNSTTLWIEILSTDTGDPMRDIHIWLPGYSARSESIFTPWILSDLQQFSPIRPMQWNFTNETDVSDWSDRAQLDWYTWGAYDASSSVGVPYEVQIDLANELGSDLWITLPHQATDDFVLQLATLIHERLNPDLKVWVEYTNEHWNVFFSQNSWLHEQSIAVSESENNEDYFLYHHYGRRSGEVLAIFDSVFADNPDRIVGILGGFAAWSYPAEAALAEIDAQGYLPLVDALAIAPYIGNAFEGEWDVDALLVDMDVNNLTEEDYARIFEEMYAAIDATFTGDGESGTEMRRNRQLAEQYGIDLVAYEAGQHLTAYDLEGAGFFPAGDDIVGIYDRVNARPEMYDLYLYYLDAWVASGGGTIVPYHYAGSWNEFETFGHKAYATQPIEEAHKYRALLDWLNQ